MIISFTGPSGIGKGYIQKHVLRVFPDIKELPWFTTRPLRPNDGNNRIHLELAEFNRLAKQGELVLIQDLYEHRYGIRRETLTQADGLILTEFHCNNIRKVLELGLESVRIALVTDNYDMLRKRLVEIRQTETQEQIHIRLAAAMTEIDTIRQNAELFTSIITVNEDNTATDQVLAVLAKYITTR